MNKLFLMGIKELLNRKYFEWQVREGRKTVEDFANLFGVSQGLMSQWMNGKKEPGSKYKQTIIDMYGREALEAMGIDPDLYTIQQNWDDLSPEKRKQLAEQSEQYSIENDTKRTHQKRTTRKSDHRVE